MLRVRGRLLELGMLGEVRHLSDSARTAQEAAEALDTLVGQVASAIVFKLPDGLPLFAITNSRHRVDAELVAKELEVAKLHRADADYVREWSGFSIGGVPSMDFARN